MTGYRYSFFYRVEDEGSQAVTTKRGISAVGTAKIDFSAKRGWPEEKLRRNVERHLHWNSDYKSPFISVYADKYVAYNIAKGRKKLGKRRVRVTKIDISKVDHGEVKFHQMRRLAKRLGIWIPDKAYNNSEHEWVFLHHIPPHAIVYGKKK